MTIFQLYTKLQVLPFGNWLFSRLVSLRVPYFATIRPQIDVMQAGEAVVLLKKRRKVHNHISTVHVIAICNALELAMGMCVEASIPKHLRWLPKGMNVRYPAKASSDIRAVAEVDVTQFEADQELTIDVKAYRSDGEVVVEGEIVIWVTAKPNK